MVNDNVEKSLRALVFNAQSIRNKMDLFRALLATETGNSWNYRNLDSHLIRGTSRESLRYQGTKRSRKID